MNSSNICLIINKIAFYNSKCNIPSIIIYIIYLINIFIYFIIIIKIINFNLLNINYFNNIYITNLPPISCTMTTSTSFSISFSTLWRCKFTAKCTNSPNDLTIIIDFYIMLKMNRINSSGDSGANSTTPVEEIDDDGVGAGLALEASVVSLVKLS